MPTQCIPIHYATTRRFGGMECHPIVSEVNENSTPPDVMAFILSHAGWVQNGGNSATGTLLFLISVAWIGSDPGAAFILITEWLGKDYGIFDPANPPTTFPSGPRPIIFVPEGVDWNGTMHNMAGALTNSLFTVTWDNVNTLIFTATASGTSFNNFTCNGILGASMTTVNGGYIFRSKAANGLSVLQVGIHGGGGKFGVALDAWLEVTSSELVPLGTIQLATLFEFHDYDVVANEYQVVLFERGTTVSPIIVCAPFVLADFVAQLGPTAFLKGFGSVVGAGFCAGAAIYTDGVGTRVSPNHFIGNMDGLMYRYVNSFNLTVSSGKTLAYEHNLVLPLRDGTWVKVGSIWDTYVESAGRDIQEDEIEYDQHVWRPLFTETGPGPALIPVNRVSSTLWLAYADLVI